MSPARITVNWKHTILYLTLIISLIYTIETLISHKLQVNHNQIRLKRSPNLPLRFRDDGTFKILQVRYVSPFSKFVQFRLCLIWCGFEWSTIAGYRLRICISGWVASLDAEMWRMQNTVTVLISIPLSSFGGWLKLRDPISSHLLVSHASFIDSLMICESAREKYWCWFESYK